MSLTECTASLRLKSRVHVSDFIVPVSNDSLSIAWRDRLNAMQAADPAVRDRDLKLLGWLEYAENLLEILRAQQTARIASASDDDKATPTKDSGKHRPDSGPSRPGGEEKVQGQARRAVMIWRKWGSKWDNWATSWNVRVDP